MVYDFVLLYIDSVESGYINRDPTAAMFLFDNAVDVVANDDASLKVQSGKRFVQK